MSSKYGFNIGESDMKTLLFNSDRQKNGVESWRQLFSGAAENYARTDSSLVKSYRDTVSQAYKAHLMQQDAIIGAGLSSGATQSLVDSNKAALHSAYQTYIQNYNKNAATNMQNYSDTIGAYNQDLSARAQNFSKLYNYAYKYLTDELGKATITNGDTTSSWLADHDLGWLANTEGTPLSWGELSSTLFNDDRTITDKGKEFFDAMFNAQTGDYTNDKGERVRGFDEWLGDTDAELRDWYMEGDVYNNTDKGTNFGTAKQLLGLESTDESYHQSEYTTHQENIKKTLTDAASFSFSLSDKEMKKINKKGKKIDDLETRKDKADWKLRQGWLGNRIENKTDKIDDYLAKYADAYTNQIAKVNKEMKSMVGSERYNEFAKKYATEIKALEDEIAKVKDPSNRNLITDETIETKYTEYIALWQKFIEGEDKDEDTES